MSKAKWICIELSNLLKRNVSTYDWWNLSFTDCIYEMWKEDFEERAKEGNRYYEKDWQKIYVTSENFNKVDYDFNWNFDNVKIWIADLIWSRIIESGIDLEEVFKKYWITYIWNDFYTPHYYNYDNDSYDIYIAMDDEGIDFMKYMEDYGLTELVQDYIDNVKVKSYDWYCSFEPDNLDEVQFTTADFTCVVYAILKKEGIYEELQDIFEEIVMNCDVLYIFLENMEQKYTIDEYILEDWSISYSRTSEGIDRKTYDLYFEEA